MRTEEQNRRYNSRPDAVKRRQEYNKRPEVMERAAELRITNKDAIRDRERQKRYGLKPGEWDAIFKAQGRKCAICSRTKHVGRNWHTDHCHTSKRVRGILCHPCNHMLGGAKDQISTLLSGVAYLQVLGG